MPKVSYEIGLAILGFILTLLLVVLDKAGKLKGPILLWLLAFAALMTVPLVLGNPAIENVHTEWRWWIRGFALALVVFVYWAIAIWISPLPKEEKLSDSRRAVDHSAVSPSVPSLVFIFGAPLGDNDSAQWIMMYKHFGSAPALNCDIIFSDDDRKNVEHEWLVKHPNSPYPPPGLAGVSQVRIYIPEASVEGSVGTFNWQPLDPNSQHYTVSITCRDGVFVEKWEVSRVNGILRSAITIEHGPQWIQNNPGQESIVFRYRDPEFIQTSLATEMPKVKKGKVVHAGWKPNHRFEVPAAIIDPNGNVQVVSAIKLPDGSTLTDFGSWNILTRHFGDEPVRPTKQ
jgi:hypothetical protein